MIRNRSCRNTLRDLNRERCHIIIIIIITTTAFEMRAQHPSRFSLLMLSALVKCSRRMWAEQWVKVIH
jgi:hypothetical protein